MVKSADYIEIRLFINGEFVTSDETFTLIRPFDNEILAAVSSASAQHVNAAVAAAKAAFPAWNALGCAGRKPYLVRFAALMRENLQSIALLESLNLGRVFGQTASEVEGGATMFEYMAETAIDITGTTRLNDSGKVALELKQPFGVVGAITPWNIPTTMFCWKVSSAVAAGNTVVIKSSEKAPLTSLKLARLVKDAGFPPGVINVLSGPGNPTGAALAAHKDVRKLSFTGSTATGRHLMKVSADTNMKKLQLELGGNSPCIIFPDADLAMAAAKTSFSGTLFGGQACIANARILVHESIVKEYLSLFMKHFSGRGPEDSEVKIVSDPTDDEASGVVPLVDQLQFDKVMRFVEEGKRYAKPLTGGHRVGNKGYFIAPTAFLNLPQDCRLIREEIFGPVVCINTFKTEEEALAMANDTEYGLYASVFTKDVSRAMRFAKGLEAGMCGVNTTSPDLGPGTGFGGWKGSGSGRDGWSHGLDSMLELKAVTINI